MRVDLLRSKEVLDRTAISSEFSGASGYRGADGSAELVHAHFEFDDYQGDPPHARVSLSWEDVEAIIAAFAKRGHPGALRLQRAEALAAAVGDLINNSN
ncbi:MAG: hypothetical protein ABR929_14545 [Roseiarcus sp.]|jgi:hypothetical protein